MKLNDLSDTVAESESRRLLSVINARRKKDDTWLNHTSTPIAFDENSAFVVGMKTLFRYARGADIPPFVVRDFLDDLLDLLFAGIASGVLALPSFQKMADRPWAHAWQRAEIRLAFETDSPITIPQLAHLLALSPQQLRIDIAQHIPNAPNDDLVPRDYLKAKWNELRQSCAKT